MSELTLNQIMEALKLMSTADNPASIHINDDGRFYLQVGLYHTKYLTQTEFYDVCMQKLEAGGKLETFGVRATHDR